MSPKAYLIFRPVMDYEGSIEPHLICETEERAKRVVAEMRAFCLQVQTTLPPKPLFSPGVVSSEIYMNYTEPKWRMLNAVDWPYGINMAREFWGRAFDPECIDYMELPAITASEGAKP